jgi:hypothetical protein
MTPDPIAQAEAVARIRDDLTLNADPILSFLDRLVERAVWRSSDPDELVAAFAGAQAIEFRSRLRNYIAAVALREANREASLRDALAASVIAANTRDGLSRLGPEIMPVWLMNDNGSEQPGAA